MGFLRCDKVIKNKLYAAKWSEKHVKNTSLGCGWNKKQDFVISLENRLIKKIACITFN